MNLLQNLNHFIKELRGIDTELGFEEQVHEAAARLRSFIERGKRASSAEHHQSRLPETGFSIAMQYEYPYLSVVGSKNGTVVGSSTIFDICLLLSNHHLQLVKRETETAQDKLHEFLHPLSHYMKSPLTAILGYSSLLEDELESVHDEEILNYIERIAENTKLLVKMIDDLLYLSITSPEWKEVVT